MITIFYRKKFLFFLFFLCFLFCNHSLFAQNKTKATAGSKARQIEIAAGRQYNRSAFHQWLWGRHYRKEWATPVAVPLFYLDTAAGGLRPYEAGGGRQSKTLRLHDKNKREYVLRSIDKSYGKALPEIYRNTFIESIINDQVSTAHPYAAFTIAPMAEKAKILHAIPQLVYVPAQPALDTFNKEFGNNLYLFEKRPDENWETAAHFGNAKEIISTEDLLKDILENAHHRVDQIAFVRARLFDMFIGDWGRHEDQWRWAKFVKGENIIYKPIPRDRDQTYTLYDGVLLKFALSTAGLGNLQSFDEKIKDINLFNYPARNLDRLLTNETTLQQWLDIAKELQGLLTDAVIENSVKNLPPEVFSLSGPTIIKNLKAHRGDLAKYAGEYYHFLAKEVEITGTKNKEYFEVKRLSDDETKVSIFAANKAGKQPFYSRVFNTGETKEIRLYGLEGKDTYNIEGHTQRGIIIRIIGGTGRDSITDQSNTGGKKLVHIYDDKENVISKTPQTELHLSTDTSIHTYKYDWFAYNKSGIKPAFFYSNEDRFYVSIGYQTLKHRWRTEPFRSRQGIYLHYSLSQKAFSIIYNGIINQFIGKWNLALNATYDAVRWTNFYGIGNETKMETKDKDYYRMRTRESLSSVGLNRRLGLHHKIGFSAFFQTVDIIDDKERFVNTNLASVPGIFSTHYYGGGRLDYSFQKINDPLLPGNGVTFFGNAAYTQNVKQQNRSVTSVAGNLNIYVPLLPQLTLAISTGAAATGGQPAFYQLPNIGGGLTLRGYRRERFYGKTTFYNSNELQWVTNLNSYLFNGRIGLIALFDNGRVWQEKESSDLWHTGVGGGFLVVPFNKVMVSVTYGRSKEIGLVHLRFRTNLP